MKEYYPDHNWNRLSFSERQRIYLKIPDGYSEYEWEQIHMQKRGFILMDTADTEIQLQIEVRTLYMKALADILNWAREMEKKGF